MGYGTEQRKRYQELELDNIELKKQIEEQKSTIQSLQAELDQNVEKVSSFGSRIVAAGDILNEKKHELKKLSEQYRTLQQDHKDCIKENEEKIESLENTIDDLKNTISTKDSEITGLNERIEVLLVSLLNDNEKRTNLQDRIDLLEKQIKEFQENSVPKSSTEECSTPVSSLMKYSDLVSLLDETQEQVADLQSSLSTFQKENDLIRTKRNKLKEENAVLRSEYNKISTRESTLQQSNRQLRSKLLAAESHIVELTNSADNHNPLLNEDNQDVLLKDLTNTIERLENENNRLLDLVSMYSGMKNIPIENHCNYLIYLEKEYYQLTRTVHDEKSKRRSIEEQLAIQQSDYRQLQQDYDRLVNPVEQVDCSYVMHLEDDINTVREALDEKLKHLLALEEQLKELENERLQDRQVAQESRNHMIALEEMINKMTEDNSTKDQKIASLIADIDLKDKLLDDERKRSTELSTELQTNHDKLTRVNELQAEIDAKEKCINELKDQLDNSKELNDYLKQNAQDHMNSNELTEVKELRDQIVTCTSSQQQLLNDLTDISNRAVMFIYTLCDICNNNNINSTLCDQVIKSIAHLGTQTVNESFKSDVISIISNATDLVETSLTQFIQENETKFNDLIEQRERSLSELRNTYKQETDLMKGRLQQLEDLETNTMKTMVSLDAQEFATLTQNNMAYLRRKNEALMTTNQLYLKQINELSTRLRSVIDRSSSAPLSFEILSHYDDPCELRKQLEIAKSDVLLWQTQAERMERLLSEKTDNQSCLTDYNVSVLSSIIEGLYNWSINHLIIDLDINLSIEPLEEEYTQSVIQMEAREPTIMETKVYVVQRIMEAALNALLEIKYQLEMDVEVERERRLEIEMSLHT